MSYIQKKVIKEIEVAVGYKCDYCSLEVERKTPTWFHFMTSMNWGNDSVDSFEWYDVCSAKCFLRFLKRNDSDKVGDMSSEFIKELLSLVPDSQTDCI